MAAEKPVEARVKEIIVEQLGVNADQVTPDAKFIEDSNYFCRVFLVLFGSENNWNDHKIKGVRVRLF